MQQEMFDPRATPIATASMLADQGLRGAIATMRRRSKLGAGDWPFVAAVEAGVRAWVVDDRGLRYVVVGTMVFGCDDLEILNCTTRAAARAVFDQLDAGVAA